MRKVIALLVAVMLAACAPFSNAQIIGGGTLVHNHSSNSTGGATLNGTTCASCTLSAPTFSGTTTYGGNLIFSPDGTYDIGASGATRARDFFLSRNALIGGTLGVTGTFTGATANFSGVASSANSLEATGAYQTNAASKAVLSQQDAATSQITAFGADSSTFGTLLIRQAKSTGGPVTAITISGAQNINLGAGTVAVGGVQTVTNAGTSSNLIVTGSSNGVVDTLNARNTSNGNAAVTRLSIGNDGAIVGFGIYKYSTLHATKANQVEIQNEHSAALKLSADGGSNYPVTISGSGVTLTNPTLGVATATSINFGGTTLSTYTEGTWTPSLGGNTTYNQQVGTYTRIGRNVCITGNLNINAIGTGSTTTISGLPFANGNSTVTAISVGSFSALATSVVLLHAAVTGSGSTIIFNTLTAAGATTGSAAVFGSSTTLNIAGCYNA